MHDIFLNTEIFTMQEKVAFIGYGNMANAIISAALNSDCINKKDLYIYEKNLT